MFIEKRRLSGSKDKLSPYTSSEFLTHRLREPMSLSWSDLLGSRGTECSFTNIEVLQPLHQWSVAFRNISLGSSFKL